VRRALCLRGTYDDALLIEEISEEEPCSLQLKYHAPEIGNVRTGWESNDPKQELLNSSGSCSWCRRS
jgi:hypothetical protein